MASKLKELAKIDDNAMFDAVCGSAHRIWQAGLGAFAKAQQEGGDMFDKLVQDGMELQKLTQRLAGDKALPVTDTVARLAEGASRQASGSWEKLEKVFEDRVSRSLRSLGVPSQQDISTLAREMAGLKEALRAMDARAQDEIDALGRGVAELKAAIASAQKQLPVKRAPKPVARAAKPPAKSVAKAVAKAPAKTAKAGAKPSARRSAS